MAGHTRSHKHTRKAGPDDSPTRGKSPAQFLFRGRNIHVVRQGNQWAICREGDGHVVARADSQRDAVSRGRAIAQREGVDHYVHGRDGRVRERDSYSFTL